MGTLGSPSAARAVAAAALATRLIAAWRMAVVELESDAARRWFPLLPISDLVEAALWATSLFGRTVLWRGQRYRLLEGGRIERLLASRRTELELPRAEMDLTTGPIDPFQSSRVLGTAAGTLHLRPIRAGDEPELLAFFRDRLSPHSQYLFCPHDPSDPERCLQQFADRIRRHAEGRDLAFVVERGGAVLGYVYLAGLDRAAGKAPTLGIGLADELHGHGLGGVMMDHLLEGARSLRLPAVELTHESTNERAGRLYQSRGFIYTGAEEVSAGGARIERVMRWTAAGQPDHDR